LTFWHSDERDEANVSDGWGVNSSASCRIDDKWLPFLRAGYANDGGSLLEKSISAGVGYQPVPGGNLVGVAVNWGQPNEDTFGKGLDDQFTSEVFYRWQLTEHTAITPSFQLLINPAMNPDHDVVGVFGLRLRTSF
jgi:porin